MADSLATDAKIICAQFADALPNLSKVVVLLPDMLHASRLQKHLLDALNSDEAALIPPRITTPQMLAVERNMHRPPLSRMARHFRLGIALADHPTLFKNINRWQLSDNLLSLFDAIHLRDEIQNAALVGDETQNLLRLYRAWRDHLDDENNDQIGIYRNALVNDALTREDEHVVLCGLDRLSPLEEAWAARLEAQGRLTRLREDETVGDDSLRATLAACFDDREPAAPAQTEQTTSPAPIGDRVGVFTPHDIEEHAQGIAIRVQQWLRQGVTPINIVTRDHRLARRLQAIFASRGITLRDHSGLAISTAVSATALFHLLDNATPPERLLRFARTPFVAWPETVTRAPHVAELESALLKQARPVKTWRALENALASSDALFECARVAREAMRALDEVANKGRATPLPYDDYFAALEEAIALLGMDKTLRADSVGLKILEHLAEMRLISRNHSARGTWAQWRNYLHYVFESTNFIREWTPDMARADVGLLTLRQARLSYSRGLVLAALDTQHAGVQRSPLLTEPIVQDLNLDKLEVLMQDQMNDYRRLLANAEYSLISFEDSSRQNIPPLPWVEVLCSFHEHHWAPLTDDGLLRDARQAIRAVNAPIETLRSPARMPAPQGGSDAGGSDAGGSATLDALSHAACKRAIDCPYQFFASNELRLRAEERRDDALDGLSFGKKMHFCMTELVAPQANKGATASPFKQAWIEQDTPAALRIGEEVVRREFEDCLSLSYINMHYLRVALKLMRDYIVWLVENIDIDDRTALLVEQSYETPTDMDITLTGRIDIGIVHSANGRADDANTHIVDYKTGSNLPTPTAVKKGRDIQLVYYALLEPRAHTVTYLGGKGEARTLQTTSDDDDGGLQHLRLKLQTLIAEFKSDYEDGLALPANGQDKVCERCNYEGLCRRPVWRERADETARLDRR